MQNESIIGVGWSDIKSRTNDNYELTNEIESLYTENPKAVNRAFRAINAIRKMKPGDLVWTRIGGDSSEYYLCQVGSSIWENRIVTEAHKDHDIGNFVSAKWISIGKEDSVPGKVVNSFYVSRTAQYITNVKKLVSIYGIHFQLNQIISINK